MSYIVADDNFTHPIRQIKCMSCLDTVIAQRDTETRDNRDIYYLKSNSSMQREKINLYNGNKPTHVDIMICTECSSKPIDIPFIIKQIREGCKDLLIAEKRPQKEIDATLKYIYDLRETPLSPVIGDKEDIIVENITKVIMMNSDSIAKINLIKTLLGVSGVSKIL